VGRGAAGEEGKREAPGPLAPLSALHPTRAADFPSGGRVGQ
jgi:hypothetical protein